LTDLSTAANEQDLFITADGCEAWFVRSEPDDNLWRARLQ
jgi:hypothetical protein